MRTRLTLMGLLMLSIAGTSSGGEAYLPIVGSVGVFSTDVRIFNPSFDGPIEIDAYLLTGNVDNRSVVPVTINVATRSMAVYDDVVVSMFGASGLGAIRLVSDSAFEATARIFAKPDADEPDTLGQFFVAEDPANAKTKGVLLQLKSNSGFRSNIGFVNPNDSLATVTLRLYDANNSVVEESVVSIQPKGVIGPANILGTFTSSGDADLSNAWISFSSDLPVSTYGSVLDQFSTDPTTIPALPDVGVPPQQITRTFVVEAHQNPWKFDIFENDQPVTNWRVNLGEHVVIKIRSLDVTHGFFMSGYVSDHELSTSVTTIEFDADQEGEFPYACTRVTCGSGHSVMTGTFVVGRGSNQNPPGPVY